MSMTTPFPTYVVPTSVVVPIAWRATAECSVNETGIGWNDVALAYTQITSVAYGTQVRTVNLVQRRVMRRLRIDSATGDCLDIHLARRPFGPRAEMPQQTAFALIVASLHEMVEPRLRARYLRAIAAGDTVTVGPISMNDVGMIHESDPLGRPRGWDRLPIALLEADHVLVESAVAGFDQKPWVLDAMTPNAVLLPELLAEAAEAFA
jgi:hypothetical protein